MLSNHATYEAESETLRKIAEKADATFYTLGCVSRGSGILEYQVGHRSLPQNDLDILVELLSSNNTKGVRSLCEAAGIAHSAGALQCDLRRSNSVRFANVWQVVDYNLSTQVDSGVEYKMEFGAQANYAALFKANQHIQWTKEDDYQMLIANILES